jgi:hypothetical protein
MGFLGSFVAITTGIILLSLCHLKLNNGWRNPFTSTKSEKVGAEELMSSAEIVLNWCILIVFSILAVVGTVWAILEPKLEGHADHPGHHLL